MFLGRPVGNPQEQVILACHRVVQPRVGMQGGVACQHGQIDGHVHTGQDGVRSVGQIAVTVTARNDLGQSRCKHGELGEFLETLVQLVEFVAFFIVRHARQIHRCPFVHVRRQAVGHRMIRADRVFHLPQIGLMDVEHVPRHLSVIHADGGLVAYEQRPLNVDLIVAAQAQKIRGGVNRVGRRNGPVPVIFETNSQFIVRRIEGERKHLLGKQAGVIGERQLGGDIRAKRQQNQAQLHV